MLVFGLLVDCWVLALMWGWCGDFGFGLAF